MTGEVKPALLEPEGPVSNLVDTSEFTKGLAVMDRMTGIFWVPVVIALAIASVAAITDLLDFKVRNTLTLPLIASGLFFHAVAGGMPGFMTSLGGVAFGLGVLIVPWLMGLMGAGDVKLLAGVGAWLGTKCVIAVFVASSAVTFVYAVVLIIYRGKFRESLMLMKVIGYRFLVMGSHFGKEDLVEECYAGPERRLRVIPFGVMIPIGIVGALLWFAWTKGSH